MSRAMNVNATEQQVSAMCAKHKVEISAIETLASGGTRVVLKNADAADIIRHAYRTKLVAGAVTRTPMRLARS